MAHSERTDVKQRTVATSSFDATLQSVAAARSFVDQQLGADFVRRPAALLIASELATNAVQHAASPFEVAVIGYLDGVRIAVRDQSTAQVCVQVPPGHAETGRGLGLVDALSRAWGVRWTSGGKVVWADVDRY